MTDNIGFSATPRQSDFPGATAGVVQGIANVSLTCILYVLAVLLVNSVVELVIDHQYPTINKVIFGPEKGETK